MRVLFTGMLCLALAGGAWAQRGGGARGGGGGFRGGMGGGFHGGSMGGGFHGGGGFNGVRGGIGAGGFRGGAGGFGGFHNGSGGFRGYNSYGGFRGYNGYRGFGAYRGYGGWGLGYAGWGLGWGGWGLGFGLDYGWPYYSSAYLGTYPYLGGYYDGYYDPGYAYAAPTTTVVYGAPASAPPVYVAPAPERANPVTHEYDQFGQEVQPRGSGPARSSSPIYLFAFQDHVIRAANAYWVDGKTLHYVTLQHDEKQAPLETLDRPLTQQLNRERQISIQLP